jgi:hypothetical protein
MPVGEPSHTDRLNSKTNGASCQLCNSCLSVRTRSTASQTLSRGGRPQGLSRCFAKFASTFCFSSLCLLALPRHCSLAVAARQQPCTTPATERQIIEGLVGNYDTSKRIPPEIDRPLLGRSKTHLGTLTPDQKVQLRKAFIEALISRLPKSSPPKK